MNANPLAARIAFIAVIAALALLGGCAAQRKPPVPAQQPLPTARPTPPPVPRAVLGWRDAPLTVGSWNWTVENARSTARFVDGAGGVQLSLACDRAAGQVTLARSASAAANVPMAIATTSTGRTLAAVPNGANLTATLPARDSLLDAIAFSRGRFAVEMPGLATLYLPSAPELSRVIEDCR